LVKIVLDKFYSLLGWKKEQIKNIGLQNVCLSEKKVNHLANVLSDMKLSLLPAEKSNQ